METTALRIFLAWLDMLVGHIDAFNHQHLFFVVNRKDFTSHILVFSADDPNHIAVVYLHFSRHVLFVESKSVGHFAAIVKP